MRKIVCLEDLLEGLREIEDCREPWKAKHLVETGKRDSMKAKRLKVLPNPLKRLGEPLKMQALNDDMRKQPT